MPQLTIPTIKWGKRKERSQMCELLTDDGAAIDKEYPVLLGCIEDERNGLRWLMSRGNQYLDDDGNWYQLIDEASMIPYCLRNPHYLEDGENDNKELELLSNDIWDDAYEDCKAQQFLKAKKDDPWNKVLWAISIVSGSFLIMFAIQHFT